MVIEDTFVRRLCTLVVREDLRSCALLVATALFIAYVDIFSNEALGTTVQ